MNTREAEISSQTDGAPLNRVSDEAQHSSIITPDDRVLVTGAAGFIGARVLESSVHHGYLVAPVDMESY